MGPKSGTRAADNVTHTPLPPPLTSSRPLEEVAVVAVVAVRARLPPRQAREEHIGARQPDADEAVSAARQDLDPLFYVFIKLKENGKKGFSFPFNRSRDEDEGHIGARKADADEAIPAA